MSFEMMHRFLLENLQNEVDKPELKSELSPIAIPTLIIINCQDQLSKSMEPRKNSFYFNCNFTPIQRKWCCLYDNATQVINN